MSKIIGIDLGTTNSAFAYMVAGKPEVITNAEGVNVSLIQRIQFMVLSVLSVVSSKTKKFNVTSISCHTRLSKKVMA